MDGKAVTTQSVVKLGRLQLVGKLKCPERWREEMPAIIKRM